MKEIREMICISCPLGCRLTIEKDGDQLKVSGNLCKRGEKYGIEEFTAPKRLVTSIVPVKDGKIRMVSVKTSDTIPKELIFPTLEILKTTVVEAPVKIGDVIVKNVLDTGIDIIATKSVDKI